MTAGLFTPRTDRLLSHAGQICADRGARLTDLRRQVLGLILDAEGPTGAYDLLERLRGTRRKAAPPTVYRALDFLLEQGLIHRVERLSAFVGCVSHGADQDHHAAQFLICGDCGQVTEIDNHELTHALAQAAARTGFSVVKATIEAEGLCAACSTGRGDAATQAHNA
jgi:Fur family zinc uptake transcriptional regulator